MIDNAPSQATLASDSLHAPAARREAERIAEANFGLVGRLVNVRPTLSAAKLCLSAQEQVWQPASEDLLDICQSGRLPQMHSMKGCNRVIIQHHAADCS